MTTNIFLVILIVGSVLIFSTVTILMLVFLNNNDDDVAFGIGTVATALFIIFFTILTPSDVQMIENDYYAMLENRPKCIDAGDVSLGCKMDYIDWQRDSIAKQHNYDSVKVKLDNKIIKNVTIPTEVKTDTSISDTLKTCIEQCWKFGMNSDIKKCQDECFK